jgi:hypothetical protein
MSRTRIEPSRRAVRLALVLALVFGVWEIAFSSFMADDFMQLGVLEGVTPAADWTGRFDLYTIADGNPAHLRAMQDAGLFPWFAPPDFEMRFFRPLSSALLVLDHAVFGLHPRGYRLHGVAWALVLVAAVGAILCRALPGRVGLLASIVFVLSGTHAIFCWTAARHVVVAAALGSAALAAHLRWREDGWRAGRVWSVIGMAASIAASEAGLAVMVYLLAYETLAANGSVRSRLRAAAPALVISALYLIGWGALGYGASTGSGYLDPLHDPIAFAVELPSRLAVLIGGLVVGVGADLWVLRSDLRSALAATGALASLGFLLLLWAAWRDASEAERRAVGWLGAGALASAVPFAGTPIGSRCLLVPLVGGAALIAVVIHRWWIAWWRRSGWRYRALGTGCALLAVLHLGLAPLARLAFPMGLERDLGGGPGRAMSEAELDPATLSTQTAVVLVAPNIIVGLHAGFSRRLARLPMPAAWRVLSWAPAPHRFVRTGVDTFEMEVKMNLIERAALTPGTVVTLSGMEATVLDGSASGPDRIRIRFDRSIDDPSMTLLGWSDGRLRRVEPPPIGGSIDIHAPF